MPRNTRDHHTSDFCQCDAPVLERIPWFNTFQCRDCLRPLWEICQRELAEAAQATKEQ